MPTLTTNLKKYFAQSAGDFFEFLDSLVLSHLDFIKS